MIRWQVLPVTFLMSGGFCLPGDFILRFYACCEDGEAEQSTEKGYYGWGRVDIFLPVVLLSRFLAVCLVLLVSFPLLFFPVLAVVSVAVVSTVISCGRSLSKVAGLGIIVLISLTTCASSGTIISLLGIDVAKHIVGSWALFEHLFAAGLLAWVGVVQFSQLVPSLLNLVGGGLFWHS